MNLEEEEYYRARILTRLKIIKNNSSQFRITKWHILGAIGFGIFICNFPTWDNTQQLEVRGEIVPSSTVAVVEDIPRLPIKEIPIKEEKRLITKSGLLSNPYTEELDTEEIKVLKSYKSPYESVFPKSPYKGIEKGLKKLGSTKQKKTNATIALDFFISKGYSKQQAAAIVGNLMQESGLNIKACGDRGLAYGIAQWHPGRQANFRKLFGKSIRSSSLQEQLEFVHWELNNTEKKSYLLLKKTCSVHEAAKVIDWHYERSDRRSTKKRILNAKTLFELIKHW